jgi:hypothetical protein
MFSFPSTDNEKARVSGPSEEACGVRRGEEGGEDSKIKLLVEPDGRALPYVLTTVGLWW